MASITSRHETGHLDDNNADDIKPITHYMPWEDGKLSLGNLYLTCKIIISNPSLSFSIPFSPKLNRAILFYLIIMSTSAITSSIYWYFIFSSMLSGVSASHNSAPIWDIVLLNLAVFFRGLALNLYSMIAPHILLFNPAMALLFLVILRAINRQTTFHELYKIALYTDVAALIFIIPLPFNILNIFFFAWKTNFLVRALISRYSTSIVTSIAMVVFWYIINMGWTFLWTSRLQLP